MPTSTESSPCTTAARPACAGLDVGSLSCEAVILEPGGTVLGSSILSTGARSRAAAEQALEEALRQTGLGRSDLRAVVATGYGRNHLPGCTSTFTEITCHARGIAHLFPATRLLLDIGGQDAKAIRLGDEGRVENFAMNDKCAAGTGRFFEVMARALEVDLEDLGPLALTSAKELTLSHLCTVFAESEVVGMLAQGEQVPDIARALCHGAAERVAALAERVGLAEPVAVSGGVPRNVGFLAALRELLGVELLVPDQPQIVGALGAALLACELEN